MTTNKEQAKEFSRKVVIREKRKLLPPGVPTVSTYEFDMQSVKKKLEILEFDIPNVDWFDYVINNRNGIDLSSHSDVIIGPVANDDVYRVLDDYENGLLTKRMAIESLKVKKLFNQYAIKTAAALELLRFTSSDFYTEVE